MKKFNYQISFYANNEEEAWDKTNLFAEQAGPYFKAALLEPHEVKTSELDKALEEFIAAADKVNPDSAEEKQVKKIISGIEMAKKAMHIIEHCIKDESIIDRIAKILGYGNKTKVTTQS